MAKFSNKSKEKLKGVHPDLVKVLELAITYTEQDFSITEGVRTKEQQAIYVRTGKSKTMNSKHLIQSDGYGHAVDVVPNPVSWEVDKFYLIADAIEKAAEFYGVNIRWVSLTNGLIRYLQVDQYIKIYRQRKRKGDMR